MWKKIGNIFRMAMRFCYTKHGQVCWNCGADCGFNSVVSMHLFWCDDCHKKWGYLNGSGLIVDWRGIGRKKIVR